MQSKNGYQDFKSAAAGDDLWRDEPEGSGLAASQEPVVLRSPPTQEQYMPNNLKSVVGAPANQLFLIYDVGATTAHETIRKYPPEKMLGEVRHLCEDTEILLGFGKSQPNTGMSLGPHCAAEMELNHTELFERIDHKLHGDKLIAMSLIHPCVHKLEFSRDMLLDVETHKPFGGILLEIGFWKIVKTRDTIPVYLGRIKYFLPRIYDAGVVYFDTSRMYMR